MIIKTCTLKINGMIHKVSTFDDMCKLISTVGVDGTNTYCYDDNANIVELKSIGGISYIKRYNEAGMETYFKAYNANNEYCYETHSIYDAYGRIVSFRSSNYLEQFSVSYRKICKGKLVVSRKIYTSGLKEITRFVKSNPELIVNYSNSKGVSYTKEYDSDERLVSMSNSLCNTYFEYNECGKLIHVYSDGNNKTNTECWMEYDINNNMIKHIYYDGNNDKCFFHNDYNEHNDIVKTTDNKGCVWSYEYEYHI